MQSLKTSGGLTRGRGITEQQRVIWTQSMPICAEVNRAMQELTGVHKATSEQNQEVTKSRMARDWKDTFVIVHYLMDRNPFECGENLNNIANGMHAQATVNADKALEIGSRILNQMDGISPADYTFKRKDQAITMASKNAVKVDGESIEVDPQLLFQRLSTAAGSDLEASLAYELCIYPSALFESPNLLLESHESHSRRCYMEFC